MFKVFKQIVYFGIGVLLLTPIIIFAQSANDPLNNELYYLNEINVEDAWEYTTGNNNVIVAIIDTGIDIDHPDLYENIWTNTGEVLGDGVDNDNNGYIDDINGWDFIRDEADPNPKFDSGYSDLGIEHGTLVAGIVGAKGNNNYGISGIAWNVSLMSLIALDGYGNGNMTDVVAAIDYATTNGADIINMSLVGSASDNELQKAIERAYQAGVIVVAAVGNESVGDMGQDNSINLVTSPRYPVCLDGMMGDNYILGVGSIDITNKKSLFSNYGTECLDINAPGEYFYGLNIYQPIFSNYREKFSGYWSGTSLATPLVTGAAALIKSYRPALTNQEIYNLILDNADSVDTFNTGYTGKMGKGKLNLASIFSQAKNIVNTQGGIIVASKNNFLPYIYIYNESGEIISEFAAFDNEYLGGVNISKVEDNNSKYIVAAQAGGDMIRVFNTQGIMQNEWTVENLTNIKVASLNNRILVWSEDYNNTIIKLYTLSGDLLNEFRVAGPIYDIYSGDIDSDNVNEINVLTTGNILIYNQLGNLDQKILLDGTAGSLALLGNSIITGAHKGQSPNIKIYSLTGELLRTFNAYNENFTGGIDISSSGDNIVVGPGNTGGPHLRSFDLMGNLQYEFFTLDQVNSNGINVGYIN